MQFMKEHQGWDEGEGGRWMEGKVFSVKIIN